MEKTNEYKNIHAINEVIAEIEQQAESISISNNRIYVLFNNQSKNVELATQDELNAMQRNTIGSTWTEISSFINGSRTPKMPHVNADVLHGEPPRFITMKDEHNSLPYKDIVENFEKNLGRTIDHSIFEDLYRKNEASLKKAGYNQSQRNIINNMPKLIDDAIHLKMYRQDVLDNIEDKESSNDYGPEYAKLHKELKEMNTLWYEGAYQNPLSFNEVAKHYKTFLGHNYNIELAENIHQNKEHLIQLGFDSDLAEIITKLSKIEKNIIDWEIEEFNLLEQHKNLLERDPENLVESRELIRKLNSIGAATYDITVLEKDLTIPLDSPPFSQKEFLKENSKPNNTHNLTGEQIKDNTQTNESIILSDEIKKKGFSLYEAQVPSAELIESYSNSNDPKAFLASLNEENTMKIASHVLKNSNFHTDSMAEIENIFNAPNFNASFNSYQILYDFTDNIHLNKGTNHTQYNEPLSKILDNIAPPQTPFSIVKQVTQWSLNNQTDILTKALFSKPHLDLTSITEASTITIDLIERNDPVLIHEIAPYLSLNSKNELFCQIAESDPFNEQLAAASYLYIQLDELKHDPLERAAYFGMNDNVNFLMDELKYPVNTYDNTFLESAVEYLTPKTAANAISKMENPLQLMQDKPLLMNVIAKVPEALSIVQNRNKELDKERNSKQQSMSSSKSSNQSYGL